MTNADERAELAASDEAELLPPTGERLPTKARPRWFWLAIIGGALLIVSTVRVLTGANDIDSSGALTAAIGMAMPLVLAGL